MTPWICYRKLHIRLTPQRAAAKTEILMCRPLEASSIQVTVRVPLDLLALAFHGSAFAISDQPTCPPETPVPETCSVPPRAGVEQRDDSRPGRESVSNVV
jgi:hypothetical protein